MAEGIKCHQCGKIAKPAKVEFSGYIPKGRSDLFIDGWKCECGEEYLDPEQSHRILLTNKLKRQSFSAEINRLGDELVLPIPNVIVDALKLNSGSKMSISFQDMEHIILSPERLET